MLMSSQESLVSKIFAQLRVVYLATATIATLTLGMLGVVIASVLTLGQAKSWITYHAGRVIGYTVLWFAGVKLKLEQIGERVREPAVYISNHSSTLDIFIIVALGLPRVRFVAKYELLYNPLFAVLGLLTGQIFIKRQDSAQAISVLNRAYERIRRQRLSLFVAPEGTRITGGQIGPFKKGAFRMAVDLKYPVVPIHFAGARRLCPGKTFVVNPGTVYARFYAPIDTSTWTPENLDAHVEKIRGEYVRWEREFEVSVRA
jgi:1-acyl-sn-glycerol-3-phosphate acyltransferase